MEQELETLIDDYLDGRMDGAARQRFERRMETDPEIRQKVYSATRSLEMIQSALDWATPGEEFDSKVTSRIQEITSGALKPVTTDAGERMLTQDDPEARLLHDPAADREKRRLLIIAVLTSLAFAAAVCAVVYFITHGAK